MSLQVYLTFDGNCDEAFGFYRSVFGGDYSMRSTFAQAPADMPVKEQDKHRLMHVSLPVGESVLMGSDTTTDYGGPVIFGSNFSISYSAKDREDADSVFNKLAKGGEITMPLQNTFWGAYFGSCKDKFGIQWMVSANG